MLGRNYLLEGGEALAEVAKEVVDASSQGVAHPKASLDRALSKLVK